MNLSSIVSLLQEVFLPALRQKYLFSNFEQSSVNRKYNECVPSYLQNRPRKVILHCLDRKASSARFTQNDIFVDDNETGVFRVANSKGDAFYVVNFSTPSCTCCDWTEHHYPCKHFFAIFHLHPSWDWNALPKSYLSNPKLSLDTEALEQYFNEGLIVCNTGINSHNDAKEGDDIPKSKVQ